MSYTGIKSGVVITYILPVGYPPFRHYTIFRYLTATTTTIYLTRYHSAPPKAYINVTYIIHGRYSFYYTARAMCRVYIFFFHLIQNFFYFSFSQLYIYVPGISRGCVVEPPSISHVIFMFNFENVWGVFKFIVFFFFTFSPNTQTPLKISCIFFFFM